MKPFIKHLNSLKSENKLLIESILKGYEIIHESVNDIDGDVKNALNDIKNCLENNGNVFFHSSDANNLVGDYIYPQCGPWVREVIASATDDDDFFEELCEISQFVFLSKSPTWIKSKAKRSGSLNNAHLAIIILQEYEMNDEIFNVLDDSKIIDLNGRDCGQFEGVGPERGDWISKKPIPVAYEFVGEKLKQFIQLYENGKFNYSE
jgi:hypothetical protein